jgi:hypothetical protein
MTSINNHKRATVLVAIALAGMVAIGSVHNAFADTKTITKTTTNTGVNVQTDTDQKQQCATAGGTSGIDRSCTAGSTDIITQSGGILKK